MGDYSDPQFEAATVYGAGEAHTKREATVGVDSGRLQSDAATDFDADYAST